MKVTPEIEKVARALCALDGHDFDDPTYSIRVGGRAPTEQGPTRELYYKRALAAMEALLEPSEGMKESATGLAYKGEVWPDDTVTAWQAMIRSAMGREG